MEKLTIQHIAAFGDKKLKALKNVTGENKIVTIEGYVKGEGGEYLFFKGDDGSVGNYSPEYFKPYMHHISCLTKTIQHEGREFCPYIELMKLFSKEAAYLQNDIHDNNIGVTDSKGMNLRYISQGVFILTKGKKQYAFNSLQIFQKLAEWHINFVGIPEGLYIDKSTIK